MCCDALGRMNIFEGTDLNSESYGKAQDTVRKYAADKTGSKGRAPPKGGVKYSREYENANVNLDIITLANAVKSGEYDSNSFIELGTITKPIAQKIAKVIGIDFTGYKLKLEARQVRHIFAGHGENGTADHSMSNVRNLAKMQFAIEEATNVSYAGKTNAYTVYENGKSRPADTVIYETDIGSKSYYVVQTAVDTKKKTLYIVTAFIGEKGYKNGDTLSFDDKIPEATPKSATASSPNTNISNTSKNVNEKFSREPVSDSAYMKAVERRDTESAQRMVDEAAKKAGYTVKMYHGSKRGGGFTVFRDWSYFTKSKKYAQRYTERGNDKSLYSAYVKIGNAFDTRKAADRYLFDEIRQEYGMGEIQDTGLPDWTDGYDIADYIDENGLNYDAIILDEGGDLVDGKPISRGLSYVIRNSNNIKSAEPITYDNNGNVIPLSERFKDNNPDIRYSREPERLNELRRQNETMLAQATNEDAANENERGLIKDYKRQYDKVSGIAEKLNTARQEVLTAERSGGGNTTAKKKIKKHRTHCPVFGRGRRLRTLGLRFWRPPLYQLSYSPIKLVGLQGLEPQTDRL